MTKSPFGFFQSDAILARNLFANRARHLCCCRQARLVLRNIEIGFIKRQRFDEVSVPTKDITHLSGHSSITGKIRREKDGARTEAFGTNGGHRGMHTELPRFVRRRADDGAVSPPRDNDWLAAQLRIVPLLDRRIKCIHVDMYDFAHWHVWTILAMARTLRGQLPGH